ncbi:MAG: hypothetical protein ABEJ76_05330 [Halanaeroarchaeum sp.]
MFGLDESTIAMGFAVIGVLASIAWIALGVYGIRTLADLRDAVRETDRDGSDAR